MGTKQNLGVYHSALKELRKGNTDEIQKNRDLQELLEIVKTCDRELKIVVNYVQNTKDKDLKNILEDLIETIFKLERAIESSLIVLSSRDIEVNDSDDLSVKSEANSDNLNSRNPFKRIQQTENPRSDGLILRVESRV